MKIIFKKKRIILGSSETHWILTFFLKHLVKSTTVIISKVKKKKSLIKFGLQSQRTLTLLVIKYTFILKLWSAADNYGNLWSV